MLRHALTRCLSWMWTMPLEAPWVRSAWHASCSLACNSSIILCNIGWFLLSPYLSMSLLLSRQAKNKTFYLLLFLTRARDKVDSTDANKSRFCTDASVNCQSLKDRYLGKELNILHLIFFQNHCKINVGRGRR